MKEIVTKSGNKVIVDDHIFEQFGHLNWHIGQGGYPEIRIVLHKLIFKSKMVVDHINNDKLDNRLENLREVTPKQNAMNRGANKNNKLGYKGVRRRFRPSLNRFRYEARIQMDGRYLHLGTFDTAEEAAICYNEGSKKYFGKFGRLNQVG